MRRPFTLIMLLVTLCQGGWNALRYHHTRRGGLDEGWPREAWSLRDKRMEVPAGPNDLDRFCVNFRCGNIPWERSW